jgi:N-acylglucosamine-6-phosphate 2-epimerase
VKQGITDKLPRGLIVSCQAAPDEPLHGTQYMAAMARAAKQGGAVGIRANGPDDIAAIRAAVDLPIIGLFKVDLPGYEVRITPTIEYARQIADAGADIIALDATARPHPDGFTTAELIARVQKITGRPVLADVSTLDEGLAAADAGADLVATTLSGYTSYSPAQGEPDFELIRSLVRELHSGGIPVIAEGRVSTPEHAARALASGAHAVVVGAAITRPQWITARFVERLREVS